MVTWQEPPTPSDGQYEWQLSGIPNNLYEQLYSKLWSRGVPTIFTSGTLSAAGHFTHRKQSIGLERIHGFREICQPSPYDYQENMLLYISESVPFPDMTGEEYIAAVDFETQKLLIAFRGHGAVLFTS